MPFLFASQYRGGARYAREPGLTLAGALSAFMREMPPRTIVVTLGLVLAARLWVAQWTAWDGVALLAVVLLQPFAEWSIHVGLLHSRPRRVLGRRIDHFAARNHRMHHRDPWDCRFTVMPLQTATIVFAFTAITWYLAMPTLSSFLSGLLATGIAGLVYEWTHFLIHTSYRPRSRAYRRLWRLHRLHHFKNERYWHCLVMPVGDRLLGTAPDPERVEASATARTLGVETDRA